MFETVIDKTQQQCLREYVTSFGYICHAIIPETVRFTTSNLLNTYPNIVNICVGPHGYLFLLTPDETRKLSNI